MGASIQPSTQSFAPRQFAGRRAAQPSQGAINPQATGAPPQQPSLQTSHPQTPQANPAQPAGQSQTFAQMQAAGQARPNPPAMMNPGSSAPTMSGNSAAPAPQGAASGGVGNPAFQWVTDPVTGAYVKKGQEHTIDANGMVSDAQGKPVDMPGTKHTYYFDGGTGNPGAPPPESFQRAGINGTMGPVTWQGGQAPGQGQFGGPPGAYSPGTNVPTLPGTTNPFGGTTPTTSTAQGSAPGYVPPGQPVSASGNGLNGDLESAIRNALHTPSRYDSSAYQQMHDASMGALKQQFGADQQSLDEEMARRGLGASSIGSQYQTNLKGQQANAQSTMEASLLKDAADNFSADRSSALSAGQNYANMGQNNTQFLQQLQQQLGLAQMSDKTQNRGIDAQSALANNDLLLRVMGVLGMPTGFDPNKVYGGGNGTTDPPGTVRDANGKITGVVGPDGVFRPTSGGGSGTSSTTSTTTGAGDGQTGGQKIPGANPSVNSGWYWDQNGQLRMR